MSPAHLVASRDDCSTPCTTAAAVGMDDMHAEADLIEAVLSHYRVEGRIDGGLLGPLTVRFHLRLASHTEATLARVEALTPAIARAIGRSGCRLRVRNRAAFLEFPRLSPPPGALLFGDLCHLAGSPAPDTALLGLSDDARPLLWRLSSPAVAHMLVCGTGGCGKTTLLRTLALSLAEAESPRHWRLALLDGRGDLDSLAALPHTWGHSLSGEAAVGWLMRLDAELERRLAEREEFPAAEPFPRVLVVVDDVDALVAVGGATAQFVLGRLLARGAGAGLHVAAASAEPERLSQLEPAFPLRLAGGGEGQAGEFRIVGSVEPVRFRAPWVTARDVALAVARRLRRQPRVTARKASEPAPLRARTTVC